MSVSDGLTPYAERFPENIVLGATLIPCQGGFVIQWSVANVGFGQFNFDVGEDGSISIWNECMGPKFIQHVMNHIVDKAKLMEP